MGLFSFGGSRSRSSGSSQSSSSSSRDAQSSSISGGRSGSISGGVSGSESSSRQQSTQAIAFEDVFARLFGNAESVAGSLDASMLTQQANQLFSGGLGFLEGIGGDVGSDYLANRLSSGNPILGEQIEQLQGDVGRLFREELLPGITSEAVAGGQLGGGRQGVAQGQAVEAASDAFTQGSLALRSRDIESRDAIARSIAERDIAGRSLGLSALPSLFGIGQQGFTSQMLPMQMLAQILGDPTVLTQSFGESSSFASAEDFARAFSEQFGISQSTDTARAQSQSTSQTQSSTNSLNLGFI